MTYKRHSRAQCSGHLQPSSQEDARLGENAGALGGRAARLFPGVNVLQPHCRSRSLSGLPQIQQHPLSIRTSPVGSASGWGSNHYLFLTKFFCGGDWLVMVEGGGEIAGISTLSPGNVCGSVEERTSGVRCCPVTKSCLILCEPMGCSTPGSPVQEREPGCSLPIPQKI